MDITPLFAARGTEVELRGSRCNACGTAAFPARRVCATCASRDAAPADLPSRGRVRATTLVRTPPAGFDEPITVGVVDLEAGPSLFALLTAELPAGAAVRAVPAPIRSGAPGFVFTPADATHDDTHDDTVAGAA